MLDGHWPRSAPLGPRLPLHGRRPGPHRREVSEAKFPRRAGPAVKLACSSKGSVVRGASGSADGLAPCRYDRPSSPARRRGRDRDPGQPDRRNHRRRPPHGRTTCPSWRRRSRPRGCPCGPSAIHDRRGSSACPATRPRVPEPGRSARHRRPANSARSSPPPRGVRMHAGRRRSRGGMVRELAKTGGHGRCGTGYWRYSSRARPCLTRRSGIEDSMEATPGTRVSRRARNCSYSFRPSVETRRR